MQCKCGKTMVDVTSDWMKKEGKTAHRCPECKRIRENWPAAGNRFLEWYAVPTQQNRDPE